ncbi:MAG: hypothetical protein GWN46_24585, partial [Gammaproteobacteria bacterium]|nr:hypothetical protein [Gammaproteobacteria bacterium]
NFNGTASVEIITDDQGNSGAGGALADSDLVTITVNSVNDTPVVPSEVFSVNENAAPGTLVGTVTASDVEASTFTKIYWVDEAMDQIRRANLDGSGVEILVSGLGDPRDIAVDFVGGKMYWVDGVTGKVQRANLDGSGIQDVYIGSDPRGIALDLIGGKVYWTDAVTNKIQRANLDGSGVEDLVTSGLIGLRGIALDVAGGKMYWTDLGTDKIQRANLDGSSVEDLVTTGLADPRGIALDVADGKMYWADTFNNTIQRANLDGTGVQVLVTGLDNPAGIALDLQAGTMYWSDWGTDKIQRANLDGTGVQDVLSTGGISTPVGITLSDPIQTLSYAITGGNTGGAFAIDAVTGQITVASSLPLDFETNPSFDLIVEVTDSGGVTGSGTVTVNLNDLNDAPVNTVPIAQTTVEDTPLEFSSTNGNLIAIDDIDAGVNPVEVTLSVGNGTLTLFGTTGLTFSVGDGSADATMTFTGTVAAINAALDGMSYTPDPDWSGSDAVTLTTRDLGNTGLTALDSDAALTARYRFDVDGTDDIGGNDASLSPSATVVLDAERGNVLATNGVDAYAAVPATVTNGLSQFAFSFWVKTTESGTHTNFWERPTLLGMDITGPANDLVINTDNGFIGMFTALSGTEDVYLSTTTQINDDQWHQITVSSDGSNVSLYVDGVLEVAMASGNGLANLDFYLGAQNFEGTANHFHSGSFDELRIFDRGLTAPEVGDLYTLSDTDSVAIAVTAENDPPVNSVPG